MKGCIHCGSANPDGARYCMACGQPLPRESAASPAEPKSAGGRGVFALSLIGSLLLSFVLMFVFKLPVFLLFGFLPLLWWKRKP